MQPRPRQCARIMLGLAVLMLGVIIASPAETAAFPSYVAVCGDTGFTTNAVNATEELLTTTPIQLPPGNLVRTTSRLTLPTGAVWDPCVTRGALLLTVQSGTLQVGLRDGEARIALAPSSALSPLSLQTLAAGESIMLGPGDRLIMQGLGSLVAQNIGGGAAVATVIRVS